MGIRKKLIGKNIFWILLAICILVLILIIYVFPGITGSLTSTYIAKYDSVVIKDKADCYLVRDEMVFTAQNSGNIAYRVEEGTRIRKGTEILSVAGNSYKTTNTGFVSYYIDNQEIYFTPEKMLSLEKTKVEEMSFEIINTTRETAAAGEPIFKIIKGNSWYVITWVNSENIIKYKIGKPISLNLEDAKIDGIVESITEQAGNYLVVLKFTEQYKKYSEIRKISAEITTTDLEGLMVLSESLTTKNNQVGVYVKALNGKYIFKPVKVLTISGEYTLVKSDYYEENTPEGPKRVNTIGSYDEILKNGSSQAAFESNKDKPLEESNESDSKQPAAVE